MYINFCYLVYFIILFINFFIGVQFFFLLANKNYFILIFSKVVESFHEKTQQLRRALNVFIWRQLLYNKINLFCFYFPGYVQYEINGIRSPSVASVNGSPRIGSMKFLHTNGVLILYIRPDVRCNVRSIRPV